MVACTPRRSSLSTQRPARSPHLGAHEGGCGRRTGLSSLDSRHGVQGGCGASDTTARMARDPSRLQRDPEVTVAPLPGLCLADTLGAQF